MTIDLTSVALMLLVIFITIGMVFCIVFIQALFRFPSFRQKLWHGITDGDLQPSQEDFRKTAQLFFAFVFGFILICCILLWIAFPMKEWRAIILAVTGIFLGCIGLRALK